ncbi:acyl carrier protein [Micromonospora sp. NBC_01392]|uniref:acyl carrier protein n=1 Tax=Micromonospora sp. NBC_01392 TaxID=2903588 RepID=UPI00324498A6
MNDTRDRVREIVLDLLELDEAEVTEDSLFKEDHGVDSVSIIEIHAALEKEFDVIIDYDEANRMVNLSGVRDVLAQAWSDPATSPA